MFASLRVPCNPIPLRRRHSTVMATGSSERVTPTRCVRDVARKLDLQVAVRRRRQSFVADKRRLSIDVSRVPEMTPIPLGSLRMTFCAAPSYVASRGEPRALSDLSEHDGVVIAGEEWRFAGRGLHAPHEVLTVPDADAALAATLSGAGMAQLPEFAMSDAINRGTLCPVLASHEPNPIAVMATIGPDRLTIVRVLADHLASMLQLGN